MTTAPCFARSVADHLIYLASQKIVGDSREREGITNLKLQKVLYFVQASALVQIHRPLFSDAIEAWEYGPVVPAVYQAYRGYGSNAIISEEDTSSLSVEDKEFIARVWGIFGAYSAGKLVDITHAHTPWKEAYQSSDPVISQDSLKEYYASLLN